MPPMSSNYHLKYIREAKERLGDHLVPTHLARIGINEVTSDYCSHLEDINDPSAYNSLTQLFVRHLDDIKRRYSASWTPELEIALHAAKLNLHAMGLLLPLREDSNINGQRAILMQTSLLRGLESASALIDQVEKLCLSPVSEGSYPGGSFTFHPKHYFTSLFFAATFLFRIVTNKYFVTEEHRAFAIKGVTKAHGIFRCFPNERDPTRAARLIERFVKVAQATEASPNSFPLSELVITNRLGASVMWDTFFRIMQYMRSKDANKEIVSTLKWDLPNPAGEDDLPLAPEMKEDIQAPCPPSIGTFPITQMPEAAYWTSWDSFANDYGLGFDQQLTW